MIISANRRTDIPAFYTTWFMNRIATGYRTVPNPFNRGQVARISLCPEDVDGVVFRMRNPWPLLPALEKLDAPGYRSDFQCTLLDNPRALKPNGPAPAAALRTLRRWRHALARRASSGGAIPSC